MGDLLEKICKECFEINVRSLIVKYPLQKRSFYYDVVIEEMDLEDCEIEMLGEYFEQEIDNWLKEIK